jgi:hypothetical protein
MPQAEGQSEQPSMEEILASIRRIIAEDAEAPAAAPPPAPATDDAILDLTEKIEADGTVVTIAAGGARKPAADVPLEPRLAVDSPFDKKPAAVVAPPFAAVVAPPEPPSAPPPRPEPPPLRPPPPLTDDMLMMSEPEPEAVAEPPAALGEERLISAATAAASVAALSQLADLGQHGRVSAQPLDESGRTLESLVRELLRPMLKTWLDDNLTSLVERLVREEIQRMTHAAQNR